MSAQQSQVPFEQLSRYTTQQTPNRFDSSLKYLTNRLGAEMHYLYPLYQAIGWEERFKKNMGEKTFYNRFAQLLAFAGDYNSALYYSQRNFDSLPRSITDTIRDRVTKMASVQYMPAREAIVNNSSFYRVIMINESSAKPVHRAFAYSLLEDLYKKGFRYLAFEALNNYSNRNTDSVNVFTGYNIGEPIAGELTRKALELGYILLPYEDTLASEHRPSQRDSIQAANIAAIIKKDLQAKILVLAGYNHIMEEKTPTFIPMGWWLKRMTGIDPLTIDQTSLTEGSEFEFGRLFYRQFITRFNITAPSVLFRNNRPFNPLDETGYDMVVMHPPSAQLHNRPSWLSLNDERKPQLIQPTEKLLFFVQAYYESEYDEELINLHIPADQTYVTNRDGYYCLFLRKGKYRIVLRDMSYKILSVKEMEVN
jgi:hypothetical protein